MKIHKREIHLSSEHPSMMISLKPQSILVAPIVIDQNGLLVDGYRRYQLQEEHFIEAVQINVQNVFDAAYEMNLKTRTWDDVDCFLWARWAGTVGGDSSQLPVSRFSTSMQSASNELLVLMAERKITMRKAILIQESPESARNFFRDLLTNLLSLNDNETADLLRMAWDVKTRSHSPGIQALFKTTPYAAIVADPKLSPRQKGQALLKELRSVRYPLYQAKLEHFTSYWQQLNLGQSIQAKRSSFIERGVLEISLTSSSLEELKQNIQQLSASLNSPEWARIWEE